MALLMVCVFLLQISSVKCKAPLAPALYVFGDSLFDHGNNNHLKTKAKANYKPYGVDYPGGVPTGRFTNGKTFVDFIAESLGLPTIPPYLSLPPHDKIKMKTGVNYASGSAGILPETMRSLGENLSLGKQINFFRQTFSGKPPTSKDEHSHLSKSIFMFSIGSNDLISYFFRTGNHSSGKTSQKFADHLLDSLSNGLRDLHKMGARKFVVSNIGRLGCAPNIVNKTNPKPKTPCAESMDKLISLYNTKFSDVMTQLEHNLTGSTFVRRDVYGLNKTSAQDGFSAPATPCCKVLPTSTMCIRNSTPCPPAKRKSKEIAFYDSIHPTERVNRDQATACFSGNSCVPLNINGLAAKK